MAAKTLLEERERTWLELSVVLLSYTYEKVAEKPAYLHWWCIMEISCLTNKEAPCFPYVQVSCGFSCRVYILFC